MIFINPFLLDFDSRECKQGFKSTFYHDSLQNLVWLTYFTSSSSIKVPHLFLNPNISTFPTISFGAGRKLLHTFIRILAYSQDSDIFYRTACMSVIQFSREKNELSDPTITCAFYKQFVSSRSFYRRNILSSRN
jgi:hypothetical protein